MAKENRLHLHEFRLQLILRYFFNSDGNVSCFAKAIHQRYRLEN